VIALLLVLMVVNLIVKFWHLVVVALVVYAGWHWVIGPWREVCAWEARNRLSHARARREIDAIALATARAMYEAAATADAAIIDGTAVEVRR
jgi:hypothetical protein